MRKLLALLLLMPGVIADNHNATFTLDYLALFTHRLDRRPDFHVVTYCGFSSVPFPAPGRLRGGGLPPLLPELKA